MLNPEYCDYSKIPNTLEIGFTDETGLAIKMFLTPKDAMSLSRMIQKQCSYAAQQTKKHKH